MSTNFFFKNEIFCKNDQKVHPRAATQVAAQHQHTLNTSDLPAFSTICVVDSVNIHTVTASGAEPAALQTCLVKGWAGSSGEGVMRWLMGSSIPSKRDTVGPTLTPKPLSLQLVFF